MSAQTVSLPIFSVSLEGFSLTMHAQRVQELPKGLAPGHHGDMVEAPDASGACVVYRSAEDRETGEIKHSRLTMDPADPVVRESFHGDRLRYHPDTPTTVTTLYVAATSEAEAEGLFRRLCGIRSTSRDYKLRRIEQKGKRQGR